jgi:DNA-binding response OmpR family regulator
MVEIMIGLSVYVCDDDPQIRDLLNKQLLSLGQMPTLAPDAQSTLTQFTTGSEKFDIAIIDIQLPDLKGNLIVSWLRASEVVQVREIPILFLTGRPDLLTQDYLDEIGNCRVLGKPYSQDALARALSLLVRDQAGTRGPLL